MVCSTHPTVTSNYTANQLQFTRTCWKYEILLFWNHVKKIRFSHNDQFSRIHSEPSSSLCSSRCSCHTHHKYSHHSIFKNINRIAYTLNAIRFFDFQKAVNSTKKPLTLLCVSDFIHRAGHEPGFSIIRGRADFIAEAQTHYNPHSTCSVQNTQIKPILKHCLAAAELQFSLSE